jgi:hypothetical protein
MFFDFAGSLKRAMENNCESIAFPLISEYFIVSEKFNIFEINEVLFKYDQPLLEG